MRYVEFVFLLLDRYVNLLQLLLDRCVLSPICSAIIILDSKFVTFMIPVLVFDLFKENLLCFCNILPFILH